MAWKATDGEALDMKLISRLENSDTGAVREVRKLEVPGGFIYHFCQTGDKQRSESCCFVPKSWDDND